MDELQEMVVGMNKAEMDLRRVKEAITRYLVKNDRVEYFSVDWSKLRRMYGHSTEGKRKK
jgi:RNA:NAD 2'-phosphotransferase (TPT1/KptA family)